MFEISATDNRSFLDRLLPPTWAQIGVVTAVILLLVALVTTLEGLWGEFWRDGYWGRLLTAPTIIVYILIISRVLTPYQRQAVASLRSISALDDATYAELVDETQARAAKGALPATLLGILIGAVPSLTWVLSEPFSWVNAYFPLVNAIMFGLLALVIQQALSESQLSGRLLQGPLEFDIFYTTPFLPIGLNSLIIALAFVGGSTIVVFYTAVGRLGIGPADILIHGVLILITLLIFYLPLRPAHSVLRTAKLDEMDNLRRHMAKAYRRLEGMSDDAKADILAFATEVGLWKQYEERLKAVPTWPYNAGMLRTLFASIVLPVLVTLGQRLMAFVLVELGIN